MYSVKTKTDIVTSNTALDASDFGGWQCINEGTTTATVNGISLVPGGSVQGLDFTHLAPDVIWSEKIRIVFSGTGTNRVVITRLKYSPIKIL